MPGPVRSRRTATLAALLAAALPVAALADTPLTIQVVNDSGWPDDQVFLLLEGAPITIGSTVLPLNVSGIPQIDTTTKPAPPVTSGTPLACPAPANGCTPFARAQSGGTNLDVVSPYTGKPRKVYQFTATTVGSGVLYVSYGTPVTAPPTPTVSATYRFQPVEFTYSDQVTSVADLTSIDFYGIPLELTTYAPGDTALAQPLDKVTYYTSTGSLLQSFLALDKDLKHAMVASTASGNVIFDPASGLPPAPPPDLPAVFAAALAPGATPAFLRVIGPNQVAAPGTSPLPQPIHSGSTTAWPYPSFAGYLDGLAAANYTFVESDDNLISGYTFHYAGRIVKMTSTTTAPCLAPALAVDGWLIRLDEVSSGTSICLPLPRHDHANGSADFLIYGAVQNCESLGVYANGALLPCSDSNVAQLEALANSVYGWIQADVYSALNFGYLGGKADFANGGAGRSDIWYSLPPIQYPFAQARSSNDGRYNVWAAMMYNHSDAYGFAFSDRNGRPSPAIALPNAQSGPPGTLRVWILPDTRLDAPMATATPAADDNTSLDVTWAPVTGADHYVVSWSPPYEAATATVPEAGSSLVAYRIGGLTQGTPYTVRVRAVNAAGTQRSHEVPVYARTSGDLPKPPAGNASVQFGFNWTPTAALAANPPTVHVGGVSGSYGNGGYAMSGTTPITVGPASAGALLNVVTPCAATGPCATLALPTASIAVGGTMTLTVTLSAPTAGAPPVTILDATSGFVLPLPLGVSASLASTTCVSAVVNGATGGGEASIVTGAVKLNPNGPSCTIVATLTFANAGVVTLPAATSALVTPQGTASVAPLSIAVGSTPAGAAVTQTIVPAVVAPGGSAVLTLTLANPGGAAASLTHAFVDVLPANVTAQSLASSGTCAGATLAAAGTQIVLPAQSTIPAGGCTIVANLAASTAGAAFNTPGALLTTASVLPVQVFPLELRRNGATIWASNVYVTPLGTPQSFSIGPCTPLDTCIGSGLAPITVNYDTGRAPNFAERMADPFSIAGGRAAQGPPFGGSAVATIGLPFTPIANKRLGRIAYPAEGNGMATAPTGDLACTPSPVRGRACHRP